LARENELAEANDDRIDEPKSRGAASLISEERRLTRDLRGFDRNRSANETRLFKPLSADVPRGEFAPQFELQRLVMDTLTESEIRRQSAVVVTTTDHFEVNDDGSWQPMINGLLSEKMGPIEKRRTCVTCMGKRETPGYLIPSSELYMCDGHFGSMEMSGALFQPELVDVLMNALRCCCWECGSLPGDDDQNTRVIRSLIKPDAAGRVKNRAEKLAALVAIYGKKATCQQCFKTAEARDEQRCKRCPIYCAMRNTLTDRQRRMGVTIKEPLEYNGQCPQCETPTQFRATISKLHRRPFNGFPFLIHWQIPKRQGWAGMRRTGMLDDTGMELLEPQSKTDRDAELFENYCERNGIEQREMEMSPERARVIIGRIGNDLGLLLSPDIWHNPETGQIDVERFTQQQLSAAKSGTIEWLESMASAVVVICSQNLRQTDVSAGLAKARFNELTTGYSDLMYADNKLRATQLPSNEAHGARERGVGNRCLRFKPGQKWHAISHSDAVAVNQVAELYGRVQYYYTMLIRSTNAPFWLPTENRSIKVPDKARKGAERTKHKGRSFVTDLGGKGGLMRKNLEGGNTDFSFRSVIVPDPRIKINEVGMTQEFAERLSQPVQLCAVNFEVLLKQAEALRLTLGKSRGLLHAKVMLFNEERTHAIPYLEIKEQTVFQCSLARIGSWIEVPLTSGSLVVLNRQPSLHRPSLMGHRVRILPSPCNALRIHPDVVGPYNADFDGDEKTGHVPQSLAALAEVEHLMLVDHNILNGKHGRAHIMPRQNHLLALFLMTREEQFIERGDFMSLMTSTFPINHEAFARMPQPAILKPRPLWTARQLISLILPRNLTMTRGGLDRVRLNRAASADQMPFAIVRGEFLYGVIDKDIVNRIVVNMYTQASVGNAFGDDVVGQSTAAAIEDTCDFINDSSIMTEDWLEGHGSSMGIEETMTDVHMRGGRLAKCDDCTNDPKRRATFRSCPRCRLECVECRFLRSHHGKQFDFDLHNCGVCYGGGKTADECWLHKCATILPRCLVCKDIKTHTPTFSSHTVPRDIVNTNEWPCDRALRSRLGPLKFDAWRKLRGVDENFAQDLRRVQLAWVARHGCNVPDATIDMFEKLVRDTFESEFTEAGLPLATTPHEQRHANELARWQRVGPTKYAIENRLARVEDDVRASINTKLREFMRDHAKHRHLSVDTRIDIIEGEVRERQKRARDEAYKMAYDQLPVQSDLRGVIEAGTKGNKTNVGQMIACVGAQEIDGARIVDTMVGTEGGPSTTVRQLSYPYRRYLPHVACGYPGAADGGFGARSLGDGVSPRDFWFMAVACRDSLVNIAVRIAPVGYLTRRTVKTGEGTLVTGDKTVRNSDNGIVQQRYGAGYTVQFMQSKVLPPLVMTDAALRESVLLDYRTEGCTFDYTGVQTEERRQLVWRESEQLREALTYLRSFSQGDIDSVRTVNNIEQLLVESCYSGDGACPRTAVAAMLPYNRCASPHWNACTVDERERMTAWRAETLVKQREYFGVDAHEDFKLLDECDAIAIVSTWLTPREECKYGGCAHEHRHIENCDHVTRCELRLRLCAKQLVRRHCINRQGLCYFMDAYDGWLRRASVVTGDAVAVEACQAFASENMQGALSSFHHAGTTAVVVSEGMPRSLEILSSRSTAKMATPKVIAVLPGGGYAARVARSVTHTIVETVCGADGARLYDKAWRQVGRLEYDSKLTDLSKKRPQTALPRQRAMGSSKKRAFAAREAEYQEELATAKDSRREEFGNLIDEMLGVCKTATQFHCTATLATLLQDFRIKNGALHATVAPGKWNEWSKAVIVVLVRCSIWDSVASVAGPKRLCLITPVFGAEETWTGVTFEVYIPANASKRDAHVAQAELFYNQLCSEAAERFVFLPDTARIDTLELFGDEGYKTLLSSLLAPQLAMKARIDANPGDANEATLMAQIVYGEVATAPHRSQLMRTPFTELINSVSIIYAPLEAIPGAVGDDEEALRVRPIAEGEPMFGDDIEAMYVAMTRDNELGCTYCRDGGDGRVFDAAGRSNRKNKSMHARCEPATRCLSSFVLELRMAGNSDLMVDKYESISKMLGEKLGRDHSIVMGQPVVNEAGECEVVAHVRLHVCGLDRLTQRDNMNHNSDFCRPLLDEHMLREVINTADEPGGEEPPARARRGKAAGGGSGANGTNTPAGVPVDANGLTLVEDPWLDKHLRRHIQSVLVGGVTRMERQPVFSHDMYANARNPQDYVCKPSDIDFVATTVLARVSGDMRMLLPTAANYRGSIKQQLLLCGTAPKLPILRDTGHKLIECTKVPNKDNDDEDDATDESSKERGYLLSFSVVDGEKRVERTFEQLMEEESEQITTQVEIAELHRSLAIIKQMHFGHVNAEATTVCVEHHPQFVHSPDLGKVRRETTTVALDSRNLLRVMNERFVDARRTTSNAVQDIYQVLGKMAARNRTTSELNAIIKAASAQVDRAHLSLLASLQWSKGWCMPFTVHGLKQANDDVIQQMSFETTAVMLRDAVTRRAMNKIISPSTCIAFGLPVRRLGTSAIDLIPDLNACIPPGAYGEQMSAEAMELLRVFDTDIARIMGGAPAQPFVRMPHLRNYYTTPALMALNQQQAPPTPSQNFASSPLLAPSTYGDLPQDMRAYGATFSPPRDDAGAIVERDEDAPYNPDEPGYNGEAQAPADEPYNPEEVMPMALFAGMLDQHASFITEEMSFIQ
jgi:DNA-directed RNA polymerase beta' subunit